MAHVDSASTLLHLLSLCLLRFQKEMLGCDVRFLRLRGVNQIITNTFYIELGGLTNVGSGVGSGVGNLVGTLQKISNKKIDKL